MTFRFTALVIASVLSLSAPASILYADDPKEFFSGGDWLPDSVPSGYVFAYDHMYSVSWRLTPALLAAIYGTFSGYLERMYIADSFEVGIGGFTAALADAIAADADLLKTSTLEFYAGGVGDILSDPSGRIIPNSRRVVLPSSNGSSLLSRMREYLLRSVIADPEVHNSHPWGSSWFNGDEFPTFTAKDAAIPPALFDNVWPEYSSAPSDGVFRTSGEYRRQALREVLYYHIPYIGNDLFGRDAIVTRIEGRPTDRSFLNGLEYHVGSGTPSVINALTNDTLRLSYFYLAGINLLISSMDTTYARDFFHDSAFRILKYSYVHTLEGSSVEHDAEVAWNPATMKVRLGSSSVPELTEKWRENGDNTQSHTAEAYCANDTVTGSFTQGGSSAISVTYADLTNAFDIAENDFSFDIGYGEFTYHPGSGVYFETHGEAFDYTFVNSSNGAWTVTVSASAKRSVGVDYPIAVDIISDIPYPASFAWQWGMVDDQVNFLENTTWTTNQISSISTNNTSYTCSCFLGGGSVKSIADLKTLWTTWMENMILETKGRVDEYCGGDVSNIKIMVPLPTSLIKEHLLPAKGTTVDVGFEEALVGGTKHWQWINSSEFKGFKVDYTPQESGTNETYYIKSGDKFQVGQLEYSYSRIDVKLDDYVDLHPDCKSTEDTVDLHRLRWNFKNLHEY